MRDAGLAVGKNVGYIRGNESMGRWVSRISKVRVMFRRATVRISVSKSIWHFG